MSGGGEMIAGGGLSGGESQGMTDRKTMSELILSVTANAGDEAPDHAILNLRDWWSMRHPGWRYPLPKRRAFRPLPNRSPSRPPLRKLGGPFGSSARRAFIPSAYFWRCYGYMPLDAWVNGARHRGRVKARRFGMVT